MVLEEGRHESEFGEMSEGLVRESPQRSLFLIPPFIPLEVLSPTDPSTVAPLPIFGCSFSLIPLVLFLPPNCPTLCDEGEEEEAEEERGVGSSVGSSVGSRCDEDISSSLSSWKLWANL